MRFLRINVLCVVGAMVGVTCLLTTWALVTETPTGWPSQPHSKSVMVEPMDWSVLDALAAAWNPESRMYGNEGLVGYLLLFIVGTATSFLTPLGGFAQTAGAVGFYFSSQGDLFLAGFGSGLMLAFVSAGIVLFSLLHPLGVGYDIGRVGIRGRLLTISYAFRRQKLVRKLAGIRD